MLWLERLTFLALIAACWTSAIYWRGRWRAERRLSKQAIKDYCDAERRCQEQYRINIEQQVVLLNQRWWIDWQQARRVTEAGSRN
jgi:hypothetical protein